MLPTTKKMENDIQESQPEETQTTAPVKKAQRKFLPYLTTAGGIGVIIAAFVIGFAIAWSFIKWREPAPVTYAGGYNGGSLGCYLDDDAFDDTTTVVDADWVISKMGADNKATLEKPVNKTGLSLVIEKSKANNINPAILISFWVAEGRFEADKDAFGCGLDTGSNTVSFETQVNCAIKPVRHAINNEAPYDAAGIPPGDKSANRWDRLLSSYAMVPMQKRYSDFKYTTEEKDSRIIILKQLVPDQVVCRTSSISGIPSFKQINMDTEGIDNNWWNVSKIGGTQLFRSGNTISGSGCGITSVAMAATYLNNKLITPLDVATCFVSKGGSWPGNYSGTKVQSCFGIKTSDINFLDIEKTVVEDKKLVVLRIESCPGGVGSGYKPGTNHHKGGHFAVITGIKDGKIITNDPVSRSENTPYSMDNADYGCGVKGIVMSK